MMQRFTRRSVQRSAAFLLAFVIAQPAQAQGRLDNFDQRILATHNAERSQIGVPRLTWSPALAADAARWAATLQPLSYVKHDEAVEPNGENIWRGSKDAYTPEDMVTLWIDERAAFRNSVFPDVSTSGQWEDVGHYTQVIWRSTAQVGCAVAVAGGEDEVLVCRYMDGGNFEGEKTF